MLLRARHVFAGLAVLVAAACGPRFDETFSTPDGPVTCDEQLPSVDAAENCGKYCNAYVCLGCQQTADRCRQACLSNVQAANPDPCLAPVLSCAVRHVHEAGTIADLSCSDDHDAAFFLVFPAECASC
jgi:hypothetical protein